ncbi:MAG TPA: VOC family protein [Pyrinomonadaceae bacterium]|nr:VOC family protein [Pyrinomonadaceae bacterium]
MKSMRMIPAMRKIFLVIPLFVLAVPAYAQSPPAKILYVGAISINPCQDAKVLADWYSRFGIETREYKGGYYGKLDTAAGLFAFGIHPKKADAPTKCSASISVVYRVENFEASLAVLKSKGLVPEKIEKDPDQGQFAHFRDPDGNEVTIWGK